MVPSPTNAFHVNPLVNSSEAHVESTVLLDSMQLFNINADHVLHPAHIVGHQATTVRYVIQVYTSRSLMEWELVWRIVHLEDILILRLRLV